MENLKKLSGTGKYFIVIILLVTVMFFLLPGCKQEDGRVGEYYYRTDMMFQPSFRPYDDPLPPVEGSVPVEGYEMPIGDAESAAELVNPVARTIAVVDSGKVLYNIYCTSCHGQTGIGDGPLSLMFIPPPDLTEERFREMPDGYLYWIIKDGGRLFMPPFYEHLSYEERWMIVHFIRSIQEE